MSRDFHLRCVTCDPPKPRSVDYTDDRFCWGANRDWNWCGDDLLARLPHLPLFATVAKAGFDIDGGSLHIGGRVDGCDGRRRCPVCVEPRTPRHVHGRHP